MWTYMLIMLLFVVSVVEGLAIKKITTIQQGMAEGPKHAPPPPAVTTVEAKPQTWQPVLSAVGSLKAINGVDVSTDLAGVISEIAFESGKPVKKGDLLVKLDTRQEEAQLASAEARKKLSELNLAREKALLDKKAAPQSEYDSAEAQYRQDCATVDQYKALIARKTIKAPFDGVLGMRQMNMGQMLDIAKPIVWLQSIDPIYADFSVPQQELEKIAIGKKIKLKAEGAGAQEFEGEITAIDAKVDDATRNVQVEATISNKAQTLRPGMYATVDVLLPEQSGVLSIPASSVNYAPYGDSVFLVADGKAPDGTPDKEVVQQIVTLGPTRGDQVSVLKGLKEGDVVVSSGVFKLRTHSPVTIDNTVQPSNEANPKPPET